MKLHELVYAVQQLKLASHAELNDYIMRASRADLLFVPRADEPTVIVTFGPDGAEAWLKERLEAIWQRNPNEARAIFHAARALPRGERAHALVYELLVWMANRHDRALLAEGPAVHHGSAAG